MAAVGPRWRVGWTRGPESTEAEGERGMLRRLWPAGCLVGAIVLAATSLHATQAIEPNPSPRTTRASNGDAVSPGYGRVANPVVPAGDDDIPERRDPGGGRGSLGGSGGGANQTNSVGRADGGGRYPEGLFAGLRQRWIWFVIVNR